MHAAKRTPQLPIQRTIMTAAAAPKTKKVAAKPKAPAAHPPYANMIKALGDKKGSSRQAILKYVCANYKVDAAKATSRVRIALKKLVDSKAIVTAAAAGKKGAGSFKLPAKEPKAAKKPAKPKAKKPKTAAKKKVAKKAPAKAKAAKAPAKPKAKAAPAKKKAAPAKPKAKSSPKKKAAPKKK